MVDVPQEEVNFPYGTKEVGRDVSDGENHAGSHVIACSAEHGGKFSAPDGP